MKSKKKLLVEEINEESNSGVTDEDDYEGIDNSKSKSGGGVCAGVNTSISGVGNGPTINKDADEDKVEVTRELCLDFWKARIKAI